MQLVNRQKTLQALRELVGGIEDSATRSRSSFSLWRQGFARGLLTEFTGRGKTEFLVAFLKEHLDFKVAWIEETLSINPFGIFQRQGALQNITFIESHEKINWTVEQVLRSGVFEVVVVSQSLFSQDLLRRFQILNERNQGHFFLLSDELHSSWAIALQMEVQKTEEGLFDIFMKRHKEVL